VICPGTVGASKTCGFDPDIPFESGVEVIIEPQEEMCMTVGVWIALGAGVGKATGAAIGQIGVGVALGAGIGAAVGAFMSDRDGGGDT